MVWLSNGKDSRGTTVSQTSLTKKRLVGALGCLKSTEFNMKISFFLCFLPVERIMQKGFNPQWL